MDSLCDLPARNSVNATFDVLRIGRGRLEAAIAEVAIDPSWLRGMDFAVMLKEKEDSLSAWAGMILKGELTCSKRSTE